MTRNITFFDIKIPAFFFITIFLIYGILWKSLEYSLIAPTTILILFSFAILFLKRKLALSTQIALVTITPLLIGYLGYQNQIKTHDAFYKKTKNKIFNIVATVKNIKKQENKRSPFCLTVSTQKIQEIDSEKYYPENKNIYFYLLTLPNIKIGDTLKIKNITIKKTKKRPICCIFNKTTDLCNNICNKT